MTTPVQTELHRGTCLCPGHELCITGRCLADDLEMNVDTSFEEALRHPIVKAFRGKRCSDTGSGKTVGPEAGDSTLYHLGAGEDHRGATWFDSDENVVWLGGYGWHRSGESDDAFQKFSALIESGEIYPTPDDYRRLISARNHRFVELVPINAQGLRRAALSNPGTIQTGQLGRRMDLRIHGDVVGGVAELSIAFVPTGLNQEQIAFVLACFGPDPEDTLSELADTLAGAPLLPGEIAFQVITPP